MHSAIRRHMEMIAGMFGQGDFSVTGCAAAKLAEMPAGGWDNPQVNP